MLGENSEAMLDLQILLRGHVGRGAAITKRDIARRLGIDARQVEHLIRELIVRRGMNIASACDKPAGYFIIDTQEEATRYRNQLVSRMRRLNERLQAVDSNLANRLQREIFS